MSGLRPRGINVNNRISPSSWLVEMTNSELRVVQKLQECFQSYQMMQDNQHLEAHTIHRDQRTIEEKYSERSIEVMSMFEPPQKIWDGHLCHIKVQIQKTSLESGASCHGLIRRVLVPSYKRLRAKRCEATRNERQWAPHIPLSESYRLSWIQRKMGPYTSALPTENFNSAPFRSSYP